MPQNIPLEEAQHLLLDQVVPVGHSQVSLWHANRRILGEDIIARYFVPPFDRSAMDGYALKAEAARTACREQAVRLTGEEYFKVMTGDPIPAGVDAVINFEDVEKDDGLIIISHPLLPGDNIVARGEDVSQGDLIASQGTLINASLTAVLAAQGISQVPVFKTVKIALLSTGDELLNPSQELEAGKIYNSTIYGLNARCLDLGTEPIIIDTVADLVDLTAAKIKEGLEKADIMVITGGISTGEPDVVVASLKRLGARLLFRGVAMKPGSPSLAAAWEGKILIALSGNPAAALVSFELLAIPIIKKLMGLSNQCPHRFQAIMTDNFPKSSPQRRFLRARLLHETGTDKVSLTGSQGNAVLMSMIDCNVLLDIPAGSGPIMQGQSVSAILLDV